MDPKLEAKLNTEQDKMKEIKRRVFDLWFSFMESRWRSIDERNKQLFVKDISTQISKIVPEAREEILEKLEKLAGVEPKHDTDFLKEATMVMIAIVAKHLTLEELEDRMQAKQVNEDGHVKLSRGLNYFLEDGGKYISLHIPVTFFRNSQEAVNSYKEGLANLAKKLKTDTNLAGVKEIYGRSSQVVKKHRLWAELGFDIPLDPETKKPKKYIASISREKLLEIYGN